MAKTFVLCVFLCFLLAGVEGSIRNGVARPLFAFGDSYADTGNINKSSGGPWYDPYGITVPGQPTGRFSDGGVLTDFIASEYLGAKHSPIPHSQRKQFPAEMSKKYGVNFAIGGSGVFDMPTYPNYNLTTEVDLFHQMLSGEDEVHIDTNLTNSVAFVSIAGNDYNAFIKTHPDFNFTVLVELFIFVPELVHKLSMSLERLVEMGFRTILVSGLQPLGCIPFATANSSFTECTEIYNYAVLYHNSLLQAAVNNLNDQSQKKYNTNKPPIHILNLYDAFTAAIHPTGASSGGSRFTSPLKPCCLGTISGTDCGKVDKDGKKLYTLCDDRSHAFFWDMYHPTHAAWEFMFPILNATLSKALS